MPRSQEGQRGARMIDVSGKAVTERVALAKGTIAMAPAALARVVEGTVEKGDVLTVAQVAGIMGAKRTPELLPLCHPLGGIEGVEIRFEIAEEAGEITVLAEVKSTGKTGVEMEALVACSTALLTIYDMCKSLDRGMTIKEIQLLEKRGGRSGRWVRDG